VDELINRLVEQVGIDRATAEKVVAFLKDNASEVPKWLSSDLGQSVLSKLTSGLGGLFNK
jgi:hypothetical protein